MSTESVEPRVAKIRSNGTVTNDHGLSNRISTTKYTLLSWLPISLLEQFRRIANIYFLLISSVMLIGTYATYLFTSPLNPYSTIATLAVVLMVTSLKEGSEDFQRYLSNNSENKRLVTVVTFNDGAVVESEKKCEDIKSGDIIKLSGQMLVPADMLLVMTSNFADGNQCYIETMNLDGETNLKVREAPIGLKHLVSGGFPSVQLFDGKVEFEQPNLNMHTFIGALHLANLDPISLSAENVLLRGCLFSNTDWAYGIALYTGQETKIQMNTKHAPSKLSMIERYANSTMLLIFVIQAMMVLWSVASIYIRKFDDLSRAPYVYVDGTSGSVLPIWLEYIFIYYLLFNNCVPISLYVTLELVNMGQSYLVSNDKEIYDEELDEACVVRTSSLLQELGLVGSIFSDKTGTLTRNEMILVKFSVGGIVNDIPKDLEEGKFVLESYTRSISSWSFFQESMPCEDFMRCLMLCHTVVRGKNGKYRAESPDELALVAGMENFDCELLERNSASLVVKILGKTEEFQICAVNAFNADRKRMSILAKSMSSGKYFVFCKGADNIMLPLCASTMEPSQVVKEEKVLYDFSCLGLRTLCVAGKEISEWEATSWLKQYQIALTSLQNRSEKLSAAAEVLEQNMRLLGTTAIEDRLQDEVPEVISEIIQAGITFWMCTGDKEETAVNIGRSCKLVQDSTKLFFLSKVQTAESFKQRLLEIYKSISSIEETKAINALQDVKNDTQCALVLDGPSFKYFDESPEQNEQLLYIGQHCRSVVACRLIPSQKQSLVRLVKNNAKPKLITLGIGDGANDVSMILEADVGVGIIGKEGRQAANNADFAIGQFKFLRRLLFVHGRANYMRQSKVFLYSIHKNICITLTLFWYSHYTFLSGVSPYESWVYTAYNFCLGLPIVFFGMMDRDVSEKIAQNCPQIYSTGRLNTQLNTFTVIYWLFNSVVYTVVFCLIMYIVLDYTLVYYGLYEFGTFVYAGLVFSLTAKVMFLHHQFNYINVFVILLSLGGTLAYFAILDSISFSLTDGGYWNSAFWLYEQNVFWFFSLFTVSIVCVMVDFVFHSIEFHVYPNNEMLVKEISSAEQRKVTPPADIPDENIASVYNMYGVAMA